MVLFQQLYRELTLVYFALKNYVLVELGNNRMVEAFPAQTRAVSGIAALKSKLASGHVSYPAFFGCSFPSQIKREQEEADSSLAERSA